MLASWGGVAASAALLFLYARGGAAWPLGFVALVPWLLALARRRTVAGTLLDAWLMSVALTAAMFAWFGLAMGRYLQQPEGAGLAVLLLAAPLFQPQVLAFALVRHLARRRHGATAGALAGAAAWVATEWALPKLLGDTLGHGLYPSALLRQAADLGGAAGLSLLLLLANEAVAAAWERRRDGVRAVARPLALAALVPLALAVYGTSVPPEPPAPAAQRLRMGLVQSNIVDYERLRREKGAGAVVREVLDTHYAMSHDAVERQRAQALLWSETVYPTTFGQPKSEAGAELDREILGIVDSAGVPLVFGTYDRDAAGEYNAAAFVAPGTGLVGRYRKTRLFPFTEALPAWLDGPLVRGWLPWTGGWRAGDGARVFPLRLADGREVPVLPLICLDDVDAGLGIAGARLGAQLILTMSNDSWFTAHPQGAALHHAVAAFRSIETRLPQFRVTTNGYSAVIDARGEVLAGTQHGVRTLVIGELPVRDPPRTLMVAWGDWVGRAAAVLLLCAAAAMAWRAWAGRPGRSDAGASAPVPASPAALAALPAHVAVLTPGVRLLAAALRAMAGAGLLWLAWQLLAGEGTLATNTLAQLRAFAALVLAPEAAAWGLLRAGRAALVIEAGRLVLVRGTQRSELALHEVRALHAWRLPWPRPGVSVQLASGGRWPPGLAGVDAGTMQSALAAQGVHVSASPAWAASHAQAALAPRRPRVLHRAAVKFVLLPFLLAMPAFRLHQHIAFGSGFGEAQLFGLAAWAGGFALWWAAWTLGVVMLAAALRVAVEAVAVAVAVMQPQRLPAWRRVLESLALGALYLGLPGWLLLRLLGG